MKLEQSKVDAIGAAFLRVLRDWLTPDQFAQCTSAPERLCDSHDYCDANMAVDRAFEMVLGRGCSPSDDDDMEAFDGAWDSARELIERGELPK